MKCKKTKNFSLIELMIVIGVILLLVGAMFLVGPAISRRNAESKTKAILKNIDMLLTNYKADGNNYPLSVRRGAVAKADQSLEPTYMPFFLDKYDSDETKDVGMQKYISDETFAGLLINDEASGCDYVIDGFSSPIVYYCADDSNYKLISLGANGMIGTGEEYSEKKIFQPSDKPQTDDEGTELVKAKFLVFRYEDDKEDVEQYFGQGDDITNFTGF